MHAVHDFDAREDLRSEISNCKLKNVNRKMQIAGKHVMHSVHDNT